MNAPGDRCSGPQPEPAETEPDQRRIEVELVEEAGDWRPMPAVEQLARAAARAVAEAPELAFASAQVAIALSSDANVRVLNATYRGMDKPTNVLSFPAQAGMASEPGAPAFLGDIVLAAETVLAEAENLGIPPAHHFQHLVVHGLLHLLGFDHEADAEAERMERLERMILARLGIPDPYADGAAAP
jgi:probable rRNA maturation factor